MYLLDTDTISNIVDKRRTSTILQNRVESVPLENLYTSIITLAEVTRGWLDLINQARKHPRSGDKIVLAYALFQSQIQDIMRFNMLPYDEEAEKAFQTIPAEVRRQHSQDCHIAAIALSRGFTVVTTNLNHFRTIPGLQCEDWTLDPSGLNGTQ